MPNEMTAWAQYRFRCGDPYPLIDLGMMTRDRYKRYALAFQYSGRMPEYLAQSRHAMQQWMECPAKRFWDRTLEESEKPMLDLTKKYCTRDGRTVEKLERESSGVLTGIVVTGNEVRSRKWWSRYGHALSNRDNLSEGALDLVPACDPIVLDRKYKTAKGEPVELFKITDGRAWGRYLHNGRLHDEILGKLAEPHWRSFSWDVNDHTLVPAMRKEKRVYWLRHKTNDAAIAYTSLDEAERYKRMNRTGTVAITGPHEIEIEVQE